MPDSIDAMDLGRDLPAQEPGIDRPRAQLAWQLGWQAKACAAMGSPLYGQLLVRAADDVEAGGSCFDVLAGHVAPGRGDALALRFMAAVHRLVLTRRAPALALHYPSVGGTATDPAGAWDAFRATVASHADTLAAEVARPCQTNEVGRAAGLVCGFLDVAALGLPLRLRELGASAGLNLRWDWFAYGGGGRAWGPSDSPVDLRGLWTDPPPRTDLAVRVVERRGCDPNPVDPTTLDGRLAVTSAVWADQTDRFARLKGALKLAADVPATVERVRAGEWLTRDDTLAPQPGTAVVVYHSVVMEYLPESERRQVADAIAAAGARATADTPVAWLRLEPADLLRSHAITLSLWTGGAPTERVVAVCGSHGSDVRYRGVTAAG